MTELIVKKSLDDYLNEVDYSWLNGTDYKPSKFALTFANFIKLVNGDQGEANKTPTVHLAMLDKIGSADRYIANVVWRGAGKTSVFVEYLVLYLAVFGELPHLGSVDGMIYVSDTMDNGVKSAKNNIKFRYDNSEFMHKWIKESTFQEGYLEFVGVRNNRLGVKMYGAMSGIRGTKIYAKRPSLCHKKGTKIFTDTWCGLVENYPIQGETRYEKGYEVFAKGLIESEVVTPEHKYWIACREKKVYKKEFENGSSKTTTEYSWKSPQWIEVQNIIPVAFVGKQTTHVSYFVKDIDTTVIPIQPIPKSVHKIFVRSPQGTIITNQIVEELHIHPPMEYDEFWWVYGLYLSDGHVMKNKIGFTIANTQRHTVGEMLKKCAEFLGYTLSPEIPKIGCYQVTLCDSVLSNWLRAYHLGNSIKRIPNWVLRIDLQKQKQLLLGYIVGDGYIGEKSIRIASINSDVISKLGIICERLNLPYLIRWTRKKEFYTLFPNKQACLSKRQVEIKLSLNVNNVLGIKINEQPSYNVFIKDNQLFRKVDSVVKKDTFDEFIPIQTPNHIYTTLFGRSHNCVLDDLIPENADKSPTVLENIKNVIYKGVNHALDIKNRKVIFSGTPFSKDDPITEAVESGKWAVNVWPVCKEFPVSKEDFQGAWEDRFSYEYVLEQYELARDSGKLASFNQELMLRIASDDERVIQDIDIRWYKRIPLLEKKSNFNFYITTDFATTDKQTSDYSVISVWAYNSNGDWFLVDGICKRQLMDKTIDDLFRLVQIYEPQQVGIETSGQQGAFIKWLQSEMMQRNIWFNFAQGASGAPGIKPTVNKFARFNLVVPWFKAGKMYFPNELKQTTFINIFTGQLKLITTSGIKGKDDCLDTVSMLAYLNAWKPSVQSETLREHDNIWEEFTAPEPPSAMSSYIV